MVLSVRRERQLARPGVGAGGLPRKQREAALRPGLELQRRERLGEHREVVEVKRAVVLVAAAGDEQSLEPRAGFHALDLFRREPAVQEEPLLPVHRLEVQGKLLAGGVFEQHVKADLRRGCIGGPAPVVAVAPERDGIEGLGDRRWLAAAECELRGRGRCRGS